MPKRLAVSFAVLGLVAWMHAGQAGAGERFITVASTTSTENSGLFRHLLPRFEAATGIAVRVVARGTGQALALGRNGDVDVLLVHDRVAEDKFVAEGFGVDRRDVMHNDFVIVGPRGDPARIAGLTDAPAALARIAAAAAPFASRGDDSGTHRAERRLWRAAGIDVEAASGGWYRETGSGMGATLNTASGMNAYALSDRATWIAFANKGELSILVEGDKLLFNPYGVILVNPARHGHIKKADAGRFLDWLTGAAGQAAIDSYRVDGKQLFFAGTAGGSYTKAR
jgi:tungstate transport system substrate-binding protein